MDRTVYHLRGTRLFASSKEDMNLVDSIPVGNWAVEFSPIGGYYLNKIDPFIQPKQFYGNCRERAARILKTFHDRTMSTGVLLSGEKGSGKTCLAKTVAVESGLPVIIVNQPFYGDDFNQFIQAIDEPAVVIFDEFEKVYSAKIKGEPVDGGGYPGSSSNMSVQDHILTLLDGIYSSKKLFILTCNDRWLINSNMINRPGRIYYFIEFGGLDENFIREYCESTLSHLRHMDKILRLRHVFSAINFDMLQALVEEVNRYDCDPQEAIEMLNIKPSETKDTYEVSVQKGRVQKRVAHRRNTVDINPYMNEFEVIVAGGKDEDGDDTVAARIRVTPLDMQSRDDEKGHYEYVVQDYTISLDRTYRYQFRFNDYLS